MPRRFSSLRLVRRLSPALGSPSSSDRARCLILFLKHYAATLLVAAALCYPAASAHYPSSAAFAACDSAAPQQEQAPPQNQVPPSQEQTPPGQPQQAPYANLSEDQLQRLVAPIALYPDSLVAQILAASTFPSQITEANQWVKDHPGLSPADLGAQVDQEPWDSSVKALVQFPNVLANLANNLGWTSGLGDAYYNQQQDVMNAIQVMRQKAQQSGTLQSTPQEKVENENGQIQIVPANPNIVYVPAYDPWAVYGYPVAPWPYWVATPGIWFGGHGLNFGLSFPIAPFFGFAWGWRSWDMDWYHHRLFYRREPWVAHGPDFWDRRGFYAGRGDWGRYGTIRNYRDGGAYRGGAAPNRGAVNNAYRGYSAPHGGTGVRSGPFSGYNHGAVSRNYSARGQQSMGGFHGGGYRGSGFHGGGGGHRH